MPGIIAGPEVAVADNFELLRDIGSYLLASSLREREDFTRE